VRVAGIKVVQHTPPTRSGQRVIFLTLEDASGLIDMVVFESAQKNYAKTIFEGWLLLVEGRITKRGKVSLVVSRAWDLLEVAQGELPILRRERVSPSLAQAWYHGSYR
jgi:error-prone DNA polymerase